MPPVMGAVAFLMAEMTGIEYGKIALAALPAAALYYITLSMSVYVESNKQNIPVTPKEEQLDARKVMKDGWLYLVPLVVLIGLMVTGYSAQKSAFFAILISFVIGFIKNRENMNAKRLLRALKESASGIGPIAAGFIIPFIFCFSPELLLIGALGDIIFALITAVIGCLILSVALGGWFKVDLSIVTRLILLPCSILLIMPKPIYANIAGMIVTAAVLFFEIKIKKKVVLAKN